MSTSDRFDRFMARVSLTPSERLEARTRVDGVASKLHERYYPSKTYDGSTKLLIGSHGKRTRVRPPRDVDMIFMLPLIEFTRYNNYAGNGQSQLLQDVRRTLALRYPNTAISGNGRVVDVNFTTGHSVQVVPGFAVKPNFSFPILTTVGDGRYPTTVPKPRMSKPLTRLMLAIPGN